jgi:two-component system alkaline phosphatase synthesis response regulator PhoP
MRKKILLVDDNEELLELLRLSFKDSGFSIVTATNGLEALKKARSLIPDLILLDLMLPEMDGFVVCETLRKDPATSAVPILILSGMSGEIPKYAGLESGGTDFIAKPANPTALLARIREILPA